MRIVRVRAVDFLNMMSFEDVIPSTTPRYKYQGIQECLDIIDRESEKYAQHGDISNPYVVMEIDERSFLDCFVESDEKLLTLSWETYDYISHSILIKMESNIHAVGIGAFNTIFSTWARPVADTPIYQTNTMHVRGKTKGKRADISWTPINPPAGRSIKWPTLVGEVTWMERRSKLVQDMKFWLEESHRQVKVALAITIHARGRITIEKWETNPSSDDGIMSPFPTQKIEIVRKPAPNCPRITGELVIKFKDVFLRERKGTENDFVLTESDMEEMARGIWAFQFPKVARG